MSILAGIFDGRGRDAQEAWCRAAFHAQRTYWRSAPQLASVGGAVCGIAVYAEGARDCAIARPYRDRRWLVVADARVDNRDELRAALGDATPSACDISLIAAGWARWGEDLLGRLIGDFAIAAYDCHEGRLYLARDPTGQRPLFFSVAPGCVAFSSMPSGLVGDRPAQLDLRLLGRELGEGPGSNPDTTTIGVQRVLPGQAIRFGQRGSHSRIYWQPSLVAPRGTATAGDLVEEFGEIFDTAVQCRIADATGPVATQLSSGFDSSAVTATAAMIVGKTHPLTAFTSAPVSGARLIVPDDRFADESAIAALTAAMHGIEHVIVRNAEPLLGGISRTMRLHQSMVGPAMNVGWWMSIREQAAARGARVLLTGGMGNYTLSAGGLPALQLWVQAGALFRWWKEAKAVVARHDVSMKGVLYGSFSPWLPMQVRERLLRIFRRLPSGGQYGFVRPEMLDRDQERPRPVGTYKEFLLDVLHHDDPGRLHHGALAQCGIEERDPTSDRRLAEFTLRLGPEHLLSNGLYKPLLRRMLTDRLPPEVLNPRSRGLQGADWFARFSKAEAQANFEEIACDADVRQLLDLPKLRSAIERWIDPDRAHVEDVIAFGLAIPEALTLGLFVREFRRTNGFSDQQIG